MSSVFTPKLDETPIPCEKYYTTDCVYLSDDVDVSYLGLDEHDSLTKLLNTLISRIKEQDNMIRDLKFKYNKMLENGVNR